MTTTTKTAPDPHPHGTTMMQRQKVLVTQKAGSPPTNTVFTTPAGTPDLEVVAIPEWRQILIRAVRVYLMALIGFFGITAEPDIANAINVHLHVADFAEKFLTAASIAVGPAVISLIWNTIELLGKFDNPKARA
jgi:hypothetical protein